MNKNIILYTSKNNTTKETVERIIKSSKEPLEICKIKEAKNIDLRPYSHIYIGTGIYGGRLPGAIAKFVLKHKEELSKKPVTFFIHGLISQNNYKEIVEKAILPYLDKNNFACIYLGGKLEVSSQNFVIKMMLKQIAKQNNLDPDYPDTLQEDTIFKLINRF